MNEANCTLSSMRRAKGCALSVSISWHRLTGGVVRNDTRVLPRTGPAPLPQHAAATARADPQKRRRGSVKES